MPTTEQLTLIVAGLSLVIAGVAVWATYKAPVHALDVQTKLDEAKERGARKLGIFKTLMANRATRLNPNFVQALNMIDMEFTQDSDKDVRDAWKELLDHYSDWGAKPQDKRKTDDDADIKKSTELLAELLARMSKAVGYSFDKVTIKKGIYYPEGLSNVEQEQHAVRRAMLNLLSGQGAKLPVAVFEQKFKEIAVQPVRNNDKS
jgi:hypothetical protein